MFTTLEDAQDTFSDMFKEAHGCRPRIDTSDWTLEKFNEFCEGMQEEIEWQIEDRKSVERELRREKAQLINKCQQYGAPDYATAQRWARSANR